MDDLISRQAAIDALDGEITVTGRANAEAVRGYARLVADRLKRLPSAQQEEPSHEAVKEYCRKRCLSIVDSALLKKYASAQPERKRGKWIFVRGEEAGNALYECSECGKGDIHAPEVRVSYCWNCGAEMTQDREVQYE